MARERKGHHYTPLVGYSTNVHRGETLAQVYRFLGGFTVPIRDRVFGKGAPAGLELRLGIGSAKELGSAASRAKLRDFLGANALRLFSVNAFPLRDFHARRVKENVYSPSWMEPERGRWTARIAEIVADVAPGDVEPSISTLGGCFRRISHDERAFERMAAVFADCLKTFIALGERGRPIVLAVEPEPETTFEVAADVISFFERHLLPRAFSAWKRFGSRSRIEELARRSFTVNVDTCHLSVLFEDQVASLRALERAGLRVGKLHVTNAVKLVNPFRAPAAYDDLRGMDEPRYFHQFCGANAAGEIAWRDLDLDRLPEKLDRGVHPDVVELRSHFHVPLYMTRYLRLRTTRDETESAVREVVRRRLTEHLVLETYTWPIIAGRERQRERVIEGTAREFRWLLGVLKSIG